MWKSFSRFITLFFLLTGTCSLSLAQSKAEDVLLTADFESASPLQGWQGVVPEKVRLETGYQGTRSVALEAPAEVPNTKIQLPLNLAQMRGKRLRFQAMVKAEDVVKPQRAHNGIKLMLHFQSPSLGEQWLQQNNVHGSFDWKTVGFVAGVPADATSAELIIGLEATSGKVWFDAIQISVLSALRRRPSTPPAGPMYRGHNLPRLRGVMVSPTLNEAGLRTLAQWKVNVIRWQLLWNGFPHSPADNGDLAAYDAWLETALQKLDSMLPLCQELGIMVVVDLHTPPGGRDKQNEWPMFKEKRFQDKFIELWDKIANRYKGNRIIWGYDLLNEPRVNLVTLPSDKGVLDWNPLAALVAKRVRAIDADHTIIVAGDNGGDIRGLQEFEPIPVPGVVYTVHFYDPGEFTHQGIGANHPPAGAKYPGMINGQMWNKERLRRSMQSTLQWQKDYNAHIYIGEFSAIRWAEGADQWLQDSIELFEEYGWDWCYHAFREYQGWSVEHSDIKEETAPVTTPTRREKVLRAWFEKNEMARPNTYARYLAIGNSITAHGPLASVQWSGETRGMAASSPELDYVHQLQRLLRGRDARNAAEVKIAGRLARLSDGTLESINNHLLELKEFRPDLVTVQLGENDDLAKIGREEFARRYRALVEGLLQGDNRPRVVCTGVWEPTTPLDASNSTRYQPGSHPRIKDDTIAAVCLEKGLTFVPVASFATRAENRGAGNHAGVRWHPNDAGMLAYATAINAAL